MPLQVDIRDLMPASIIGVLEQTGLAEAVLDDLAASARAKWIRLAQTGLKSTAQSYIQGIQEPQSQPGMRTIALAGWLANAIELGMAPFDLRDTVLAGSKAKQGVNGKYMAVPFRHGTPGTTGLAGGPMGDAYGPRSSTSRAAGNILSTEQAAQFGKEVYRDAKKLRARSKRQGPGQLAERAVQSAFGGSGGRGEALLRPHHKSSIYAGMRRERKPYTNEKTGKTTMQSQYFTFRTISEANPEGWLHPGIAARNFSDQVQSHVERIAPVVISKAIDSALRGGA